MFELCNVGRVIHFCNLEHLLMSLIERGKSFASVSNFFTGQLLHESRHKVWLISILPSWILEPASSLFIGRTMCFLASQTSVRLSASTISIDYGLWSSHQYQQTAAKPKCCFESHQKRAQGVSRWQEAQRFEGPLRPRPLESAPIRHTSGVQSRGRDRRWKPEAAGRRRRSRWWARCTWAARPASPASTSPASPSPPSR
jgi:hypothetical protein